jgi:hypothetical protein
VVVVAVQLVKLVAATSMMVLEEVGVHNHQQVAVVLVEVVITALQVLAREV